MAERRVSGPIVPAEIRLSWRHAHLLLLTVSLGTLLVHFASEASPLWSTAKMVGATAVIALVPGMLVSAAARPRPRVTLLEWSGIAIAVSLGLVQILTIAAMVFHVPSIRVAMAVAILCVAGTVVVILRKTGAEADLVLERTEMAIALLLAVLSVYLYLRGSPVSAGEDQIHIGVVRRLAFLERPALDNIYYAPGLVYTYPFPGTHYVFALVSRLGGLDPLFVYHKMRFFWGPAALVFLYLAGRALFRDRGVAAASAVTAILFVFGGTFADVPGMYWAQLVPYSHASDVAMNVLLPGLLVLVFYLLSARARREARFFLGAALTLVLMLALVHIREVVQLVVYLGSFGLALVLGRRRGAELKRTTVLLGSTVVLAGTVAWWQPRLVTRLPALLEPLTHQLLDTARRLGPWGLLKAPFTDSAFVLGFDSLFSGWNPLSLLLVPLVILACRRLPLMLFVAASVFAYLLIIRLPVLTIPFIYLTYPEIMYTPVRNIIFFLYLMPGAFLSLAAERLAGLGSPGRILPSTLLVVLGLGGLSAWLGTFVRPRPDVLLLPVLGLLLLAMAFLLRGARQDTPPLPPRLVSSRPATAIFVLLALSLTVWTSVPPSSPRRVSLRRAPFTLAALMGKLHCVPRSTVTYPRAPEMFAPAVVLPLPTVSCPPSLALLAWVREHVPSDAVLAINTFNDYPPPMFMTPHVVAWPLASQNTNMTFVSPAYVKYFYRAIDTYGTQPMFNEVESLAERVEFVRALGVTHVLVDPMFHDVMARVFARWPAIFPRVHDDGGWAMYRVSVPAPR
jgi:hypothetical protein